jgi:hypothetical protein
MSVKDEIVKAINAEIDSEVPDNVDIAKLKELVEELSKIVTNQTNIDKGIDEMTRQYINQLKLIVK